MTDARPPKSWIAVASADHVAIGRAAGFMQVNHGKAAPLRRTLPGDRVIYYAAVQTFRGTERVQAFVAHGRIADGAVYQGYMGEGFTPWRRDVVWDEAGSRPSRRFWTGCPSPRGAGTGASPSAGGSSRSLTRMRGSSLPRWAWRGRMLRLRRRMSRAAQEIGARS